MKSTEFMSAAHGVGIESSLSALFLIAPDQLGIRLLDAAKRLARLLKDAAPDLGHRKRLEVVAQGAGFPNWHAFQALCQHFTEHYAPPDHGNRKRAATEVFTPFITALPLLVSVAPDTTPTPEQITGLENLGRRLAVALGQPLPNVLDILAKLNGADTWRILCERKPEDSDAPLYVFSADQGQGEFRWSPACAALVEEMDGLWQGYGDLSKTAQAKARLPSISHDRVGQFTEPSYRPPHLTEYRQVAHDFIAEVAPGLTTEVRDRLANEVSQRTLGLIGAMSRQDEFIDPLLQLNRAWEWEELIRIAPFSLDNWQTHTWHLWSSDQRLAKTEADQLHRFAESMSINDWLHDVPMTQVRQWRDTFLPDRPKRGRKILLLWDLSQHAAFQAECRRAFEGWRQDQAMEVDRLLQLARQKPVARHLEWLARLTWHRLDAYHSLTNSCNGPAAYANLMESWLTKHREGAKGSLGGIDQEVADATSIWTYVDKPEVMEIAKEVAWSYIKTTDYAVSSRLALKRSLLILKPSQLVTTRCCPVCESKPKKKRAKAAGASLAPFHLLCTCRAFQWRPDSYRGDPTEWAVDMSHKWNLQFWAIARHLGIDAIPIDGIGLIGMASEIAFDRRWEATQASKRAGRPR